MTYRRMKSIEIFKGINTEEKAREWVWKCRFGGKNFVCPYCENESYWQHKRRPEIRQCDVCFKQIRVRAGTIFEHSKLPLLIWIRAIGFVMQGKRGVSAEELRRHLGRGYETVWGMLQKLREALAQREKCYQLKGLIELDGAQFGKRKTYNEVQVLIGVESKEWTDEKGRKKPKAGFAKVKVAYETQQKAKEFVNEAVQKGSRIRRDASSRLNHLENVEVEYEKMAGKGQSFDRWLPWVHKFISNAKTWLKGTHHGVNAKYIGRYLAEYTYRFNRRHDPDSLFHRALTACSLAKPVTLHALCR